MAGRSKGQTTAHTDRHCSIPIPTRMIYDGSKLSYLSLLSSSRLDSGMRMPAYLYCTARRVQGLEKGPCIEGFEKVCDPQGCFPFGWLDRGLETALGRRGFWLLNFCVGLVCVSINASFRLSLSQILDVIS